MTNRTLYVGDNLDVLREMPDDSVDLIYADPPYGSGRHYFPPPTAHDGAEFSDTWDKLWVEQDQERLRTLAKLNPAATRIVDFAWQVNSDGRFGVYLFFMAERLIELERVLKPDGGILLQCDDSANGYLQMLLDAIFQWRGNKAMVNQISWKRVATPKSDLQHKFGRCVDTIFYYAPLDTAKRGFNVQRVPLNEAALANYRYRDGDPDRPNARSPIRWPAGSGCGFDYAYDGYLPPPTGWRVSKKTMRAWDEAGLLYKPADKRKYIQKIIYLDECQGVPRNALVDDIGPVRAKEYATQKPLELLVMLIRACSDEGDMVLDPFCGSGTTILAAEALGREWAGIDKSEVAVGLTGERLREESGMFHVEPTIVRVG